MTGKARRLALHLLGTIRRSCFSLGALTARQDLGAKLGLPNFRIRRYRATRCQVRHASLACG